MSASFAPKCTPRRMFPGISPAARAARLVAAALAATLAALVTLLPAAAHAASAKHRVTSVHVQARSCILEGSPSRRCCPRDR